MTLMKVSKLGIDLIKHFEGLKLTAYKPVPTEKYYTIGIGHYGADVKKDMAISEKQAEELFRKDIATIETTLNKMGINFTQNEFDALVSFIFNLGQGNFNNSTLKKYILQGKSDIEICDQIIRWVNSNGKPLLGLKRRRVAEANMWLGQEKYFIKNNDKIVLKIN